MLVHGEELARARRAEMAELIRSNPEQAIERALPSSVRKQLPENLLALIEHPVSDRGEFRPLYYKPLPGRESEVPPTGYEVVINNRRYETHTFGDRVYQPAHDGVYLHGVALDDLEENPKSIKAKNLMALAGPPARRVQDPSEIPPGKLQKEAICGVSKKPANGKGDAVVLQYGDNYYSFCDPGHAVQFNRWLSAAHGQIWASHGGGDGNVIPTLDNTQVRVRPLDQGLFRLLYIRVTFADDPISPQADDGAHATAQGNNRYFNEGSYGTVWWETTITPVIRLPERKNYYGENPNALLGDARVGAEALGYFRIDYDEMYVLCNSLVQYDFGGLSSGILNGSPGALSHELGHNFGLPHANFWQPEGRQPGPVQPTNAPPFPIDPDSLIGHNDLNAPFLTSNTGGEPSQEYGNPHDVMGSGPGHFSAMFKNYMNWLPDNFIKTATGSTTNRIFAFDTPRISDGRTYAMRIRKDYQKEYWFSYRQQFPDNPWFANGIEVDWDLGPIDPGFGLSLGNNVLIDTTPDSTYVKEDAALVVGRTLRDPAADVFVTPVALGGGPDPSDKWIDVVLQKGPFRNNQNPTVTIAASTIAVANGGTVEFSATAQDPDGDALAFYWDFGDWSFGTNGAVQSKTFNAAGQFVVRCEVSDMKGGIGSAHVVITVGTPNTFTISGRVLDTFGNPVQGVRVHNSGVKPASPPPAPDGVQTNTSIPDVGTYRYGYTDSQGYYVIGNVPPGTYTNRAFQFGYRIEPLNFTDPVVITNANAAGLDLTAYPITHVRIEETADANEPGGDGYFRISRQGDISEDLPVRFTLTGNAIYNSDYFTVPGTFEESGFGEVVIPAGLDYVDLNVIPFDNGVGDGDKTVVLTLLLQTNVTRISTVLSNQLVTNGQVITTNTIIVTVTNQYRIPGWELRPSGPNSRLTWFQTDPTYVIDSAEDRVRIQDDEAPSLPTVGVVTLDFGALETRGDNATLVFFRQGAPLDEDLLITYSLAGSALNGIDYQTLSGKVTIPANHDYALVYLNAINDLFVEDLEYVQVTIVPKAEYNVSAEADEAFALIEDDDLPLLNIFASDSTAVRGGGGARVTISRAGSLDDDLLVNYFVTGTAQSGVDYNTLPGSVIIPAGQLSVDIPITAIASSTNKLPRTVTVLLADAPTYNLYNENSATITIVDGALSTVTLSASSDTVNEAGGNASFIVTRTGPTNTPLTVYFEVGGSAWEGIDYAAIGTNVTIAPGATTANIVIAAINDSAREVGDVTGFETIIIQVRPGTNYLVGNPSGRTMRINDDEGDTALPAVGFMRNVSSAREDAGLVNLYVRVSANPATNRPIQVEYRVIGGSAVSGVNYVNEFPDGDFTGQTGILNIVYYEPPRPPPEFFNFENGIYEIPVQVLNDGVSSGNKTLTISLFNPTRFQTNVSYVTNMGNVYSNVVITRIPTNAYLGPSVSHTLTILDVGITTVSIAAATNAIFEGGAANQFIVTREGATNAPLTVAFAISGTAARGSDFVLTTPGGAPLTNTVTIPAGTNAVAIVITPIDDPTEEVLEDVIIDLLARPNPLAASAGAGAYTVGSGTAFMYLVSNDGTVQFSLAAYDALEPWGLVGAPVFRSGPTNLAVSVDYFFTDISATNGLDYFGVPDTLEFPPGEVVQYVPIFIVDDTLVETNETFSMSLTNPTGGVQLGGQRQATVRILSDDREFVFASGTFRSPENSGAGEVVVVRNGATNEFDSVTFTATNLVAGSADFLATNIVLEFMPGEASKTVSVVFFDDDLFEGNEAIDLALSNPSPGSQLGAPAGAALLIVDDECALEFDVAGYSVKEYSNYVYLVVRRVGGTVNPVTVDYTTSDGTATNGFDYVGGTSTIFFRGDRTVPDTNGGGGSIFVPGDATQLIAVPIIDDAEGEGNETFTVTLHNPLGPDPGSFPTSTLLGSNVTAEVTILDNELPGNVDYEFVSGPNAPVHAVAIAPRGGLEEFAGRVVIGGEFTQIDGITINRVARLLPNGLLDSAFNPGAGVDGIVYAVAVQPDGKVVIGGDFARVDSTPRGRVARLNADGDIDTGFVLASNAVDGIVRAVAVQTNGQVVIAGEFGQVNGVARSRIARLNVDGSLDTNFTASLNGPGLALAIQPDGRILVGGAFSSANGSARGGVARLNTNGTLDTSFTIGSGFNAAVNTLALQTDGRVLVGGAFTLFNGASRNYLTRLDATGAADVGFNTGLGPNATVRSVAVHSGGKILIAGDFISYNGVPANRFARLKATGSYDFVFATGTGADATVRSVVVQPDTAVIIGGDFTVVNGIARPYVARIHGDEKSNISSVDFANANFTVDENAGVATIGIVRSGPTNRTFTIQYATRNGTALNGQDYIGTTNTMTFVAGQISNTFNVPIIDDPLIEGDETVLLSLTNISPGIDVSGQSTAVLTILDDERFVQLSATNYSVRENFTNAVVTVTRVGGLSGPLTVTLTTSNGTATAPADYTATSVPVTFASGQSNATVLIPITDDGVGEIVERFLVFLSDVTGGNLGSPTTAKVTIIDDDVSFGTRTFTNAATILIVDASPAAPYPSSIVVSNMTGVVSKVVVTLDRFYHTFPDDVDMLLVGPRGQKVLLMSDAGGADDVVNATLRFDDGAATFLPDATAIVTSTNKASNYGGGDPFQAPAPAAPYSDQLAVYNGTDANGTWSLYIMDDRGQDSGAISNGWRLSITTVDPATAADVGITLADAPDPIAAGATLTYTVTVTNKGPMAATGVLVTNTFSSTAEFLTASGASGGCSNVNGYVVCALGDIPVNGSATVLINVRPLVVGTLTNTATVWAIDPDFVTIDNVASTATTITPGTTADLRVTLSDSPDPVFAGQNVSYRFTVTNRGPLSATGVWVTNRIPENGAFVSLTVSRGTVLNFGNELVIDVGTLANNAGLVGTLVIQSRVGGTMTNTVTARANEPDFSPTNYATEITTVLPAADLVVTMTDSRDPVGVNADVTYTITVENLGPNNGNEVTLFNTLPAGLTLVSYSGSQGAVLDYGGVLAFQFGTVSNGASAMATVVMRTTTPGVFTNQATAVGQENEINPVSNSAVETTTVSSGGTVITVSGIIDNGVIQLGVNPEGHLNVEGGPPSLSGTTAVGLRYLPTGAESTAPGCLCEGWGVADAISRISGGGNEASDGGPFGVVLESFTADGVTARSVVRVVGGGGFFGGNTNVAPTFRVTHFYHPSSATTNLYQVDVTIENISTNVVDVLYRRVMDWDIEPTPFNEYSTVIKGNSTNLYFTSDNGFASADPLSGPSQLQATGTFIDSGPSDHGALFDFGFGLLMPGQSKSFVTYYGAAGTEQDAITAIARVGAEAYSFGQASTAGARTNGTPNTFIFGFGGIGGSALAGADVRVLKTTPSPVAALGSVFNYTVRVTNAGPDTATEVILSDTLPDNLNLVNATASRGALSINGRTITVNMSNLVRNASGTLTISVIPTAEGNLTNVATVSTTQIDYALDNNTATNIVNVVSAGTFANPNPITIYDAAPALPYPSVINISNAPDSLLDVDVVLVDVNHAFPADLDILVVGPQGQSVMLMSDAGAGFDMSGVTLRFDDEAAGFLPPASGIVSGTFKPTNLGAADYFFAPAPPEPYGTALGVFRGTNPNGAWSLFIMDDQGTDTGFIGGGWRLSFTFGQQLSIVYSGGNVVISWAAGDPSFQLERAASPSGPWSAVGVAPVVVNGRYTVTLPASGVHEFFRLRRP